MNKIEIHTFKGSFGPIIELLNSNEIKYQMGMERSGVQMSSSAVVEVIVNASVWVSLAAVLIAFIKARNSRYVKITTKDNQVIEAKGLDSKQLQEVLEHSKSIMAIETDAEKP